jgi:hypothetical protein
MTNDTARNGVIAPGTGHTSVAPCLVEVGRFGCKRIARVPTAAYPLLHDELNLNPESRKLPHLFFTKCLLPASDVRCNASNPFPYLLLQVPAGLALTVGKRAP